MSTSILPGERPDRMEEECAVFGVFAPGEDVARMTCFGLQALQHRGQESAGIAVGDGETVMVTKDLGLVTQVFDEASLAALEGFVAVGPRALRDERRAGIVGGGAAAHLRHRRGAHRARPQRHARQHQQAIRARLIEAGEHLLRRHRLRGRRQAHRQVSRASTQPPARGHPPRHGAARGCLRHGAARRPDSLYAFRDPNGIRPLVHRQAARGARLGGVVGDVRPGHRRRRRTCATSSRARWCASTTRALVQRAGRPGAPAARRASSSTCTSPGPTRVMDGRSVYQARRAMGRILAREDARRGGPRARRARLGRACGAMGYAARERHPVFATAS